MTVVDFIIYAKRKFNEELVIAKMIPEPTNSNDKSIYIKYINNQIKCIPIPYMASLPALVCEISIKFHKSIKEMKKFPNNQYNINDFEIKSSIMLHLINFLIENKLEKEIKICNDKLNHFYKNGKFKYQ